MRRDTFHSLFLDNPMLLEVARAKKRYFSWRTPAGVNTVFILVSACYVLLVLMTIRFANDWSPFFFIQIQLVAISFAVPAMLHGAIAGERERRTWDMLIAAPVSRGQIVVGKLLGALSAVGLWVTLMLVPIGITTLFSPRWSGNNPSVYRFLGLIASELTVISYAAFLCALTLFFSARVKRPFVALGIALGFQLLVNLLAPSLLATFGSTDSIEWTLGTVANPYLVIEVLSRFGNTGSGITSFPILETFYLVYPWVVYLVLTGFFVLWTVETLNYADNNVEFLPKKRRQTSA